MRTPSFRLKIALLSTGISGVVLAAFGTATYFVISDQKTEAMDTEIRSLAMRHRGWLSNRQNPQRIGENFAFILGDDAVDEMILLLKDAGGSVLHASNNWPAGIDPAKLDTRLEDDPAAPKDDDRGPGPGFRGGRGWGGVGRGAGPGGGQVSFTKTPHFLTKDGWRLGMMGNADTTLVIGLNTRHSAAELDQLRNRFLLALPAALGLVALGGWMVAGRALRPLRVIADTAERVTASGLDQRIPASDEDPEISRMIVTLNRMMDRLERSFQQATRFSADASHELKTPLAIMQGELENALQESEPGSREQQVFGNLLEETQRLKTITSGLLLLARADSGQLKLSLETVDFSTMLAGIIEDARVLGEESRISFAEMIDRRILVNADSSLLRNAIMNLFVNAVKYNEAEGRIEATLSMKVGKASLTICNTGPGIPEEDQTRIFTRFHRADTSRNRCVDGVGLGLNLSREILRAHGGDLVLQECRPGWTCFEVTMPLASEER